MLDVASGTAAVAVEVARRHGCRVIGLDQSPEMLAEGRRRVDAAGLGDRIELREGRAEELPFQDATFDGLTFTYLLRYVDDPAATMRELARVVRPGGRIAMLEFVVPPRPLPRAAWGALRPPGASAGRPRGLARLGGGRGLSGAEHPRASGSSGLRSGCAGVWEGAGIQDVQARLLSLGGGIVMWGVRAG